MGVRDSLLAVDPGQSLDCRDSELSLTEGLVGFNGGCALSSCLAGLKDEDPGSSSADACQSSGALAAGRQASAVTGHVWGQGQVHESGP